jgi:ATP-dependent Clp protease ATP-binding subunit ClpA
MSDTPKPQDAADGGCPPATCSESSWTPETAVQWTPRAKKMLALARKVAIDYGQNYVGSEHLLAGIIREKEGFAARVLEAHGLTMEWLIKECGWQTMADRIEERERAEYERLRAKFDPQNS